MPASDLSRRKFLGACCASVGATGLLSTLAQLRLMGAVASPDNGPVSPPRAGAPQPDYKALVCLFLAGGNDANNLVIPTDAATYAAYAAGRGALALPQNAVLPITPRTNDGRTWGIHPAMTELRNLFNSGQFAVLANVGTGRGRGGGGGRGLESFEDYAYGLVGPGGAGSSGDGDLAGEGGAIRGGSASVMKVQNAIRREPGRWVEAYSSHLRRELGADELGVGWSAAEYGRRRIDWSGRGDLEHAYMMLAECHRLLIQQKNSAQAEAWTSLANVPAVQAMHGLGPGINSALPWP
jgi:hypothetical protein